MIIEKKYAVKYVITSLFLLISTEFSKKPHPNIHKAGCGESSGCLQESGECLLQLLEEEKGTGQSPSSTGLASPPVNHGNTHQVGVPPADGCTVLGAGESPFTGPPCR